MRNQCLSLHTASRSSRNKAKPAVRAERSFPPRARMIRIRSPCGKVANSQHRDVKLIHAVTAEATAVGFRATDRTEDRLSCPTVWSMCAGLEESVRANRVAVSQAPSIRLILQTERARLGGEGRIPPSWAVEPRSSRATAELVSFPAHRASQPSLMIHVVGGRAL